MGASPFSVDYATNERVGLVMKDIDPEHSIADAWVVVEKMNQAGYTLSLCQDQYQVWHATFWQHRKGDLNNINPIPFDAPENDNPAIAICEAALVVKEWNKECTP